MNFLEVFNHTFVLFILFPAIFFIGLYFTLKLRFIQITQLKTSFFCLTKSNLEAQGSISRFAAVSSILAGNFGTGNIAGMAIALTTGGPGALIWMWIMAFFGSVIQYASCLLGILYRRKGERGEYVSGPMYYLQDGLNNRPLAILFALCTIFGAITVGNFAQIHSLILPLETLGFNPFLCSLGLSVCVGLVILGGIKRLAHCAAFLVPFMALLYLGASLIILALHYNQLGYAFLLLFQHAFGLTPIVGGALGVGVLKALSTGFDRGLFATDAGTGLGPILQANSRAEHPVMEGIATFFAPLMVMIVCTATGLVLIVTGAWTTELKSTNMVMHAFSIGLGSASGAGIVMVSLLFFAYTTILAWYYCAEKALEFLVGLKRIFYLRAFFLMLIPLSCFIHLDLIWSLADLAITSMLFLNLIGVTGLSRRIINESLAYVRS